EDHPAAALIDLAEDLHGMAPLLAGLDLHPLGHAAEILRLEVAGHRQVKIGRRHLRVDLSVEGFLNVRLEHDADSPGRMPARAGVRFVAAARFAAHDRRQLPAAYTKYQRPHSNSNLPDRDLLDQHA